MTIRRSAAEAVQAEAVLREAAAQAGPSSAVHLQEEVPGEAVLAEVASVSRSSGGGSSHSGGGGSSRGGGAGRR